MMGRKSGWKCMRRTKFLYIPDLYSNSLDLTAPMAERCYDLVAAQDKSSRSQHEIIPLLFAAAFGSKTLDQRQILYERFWTT